MNEDQSKSVTALYIWTEIKIDKTPPYMHEQMIDMGVIGYVNVKRDQICLEKDIWM